MNLRMPITKEKIKNHFAYAWWQYVLVIAVSIFGWNLLYTTTHYRSPEHLKVEWYYDSYQAETEKTAEGLMEELHTTLLPEMEVVSFVPVVLDSTYGEMQLTIWISAGEGDLFTLNKDAFKSMAGNGGMIDLAPYIEDGSLDVGDMDLSMGYVTDQDTGRRLLAGIPAENLPGLQDYGLVCENEYFGVSATGGNIDNTVKLLNWLIQNMR